MQQISKSQEKRRELRQKIRAFRKQIPKHLQNVFSTKIALKIFNLQIFIESQNIACYLAAKGEANPYPIIQKIWELGKNCYLPIIDSQSLEKKELQFILFREGDKLQENRLGILEPAYNPKNTIAAENLDMVITPLVGFDIGGNRLGQGGGFYDKTFSFKLKKEEKKEKLGLGNTLKPLKPYLVGIAYEKQKLDELDASPWDVKLDMVATEENLYVFNDFA